MEAALSSRRKIIERKVTIGNAVEAVGGGTIEAERFGSGIAVEGKAGSRKCRRAERSFVRSGLGIGKARNVAPKHLVVSH